MTLIVSPLHEVGAVLATRRPSHLVTLGSPGGPVADVDHAGPRLRLAFHDVAAPRPGLTPATAGDVERLLAFARGWDGNQPMLIHCWAGVSRSPAAAARPGSARARRTIRGNRMAQAPCGSTNIRPRISMWSAWQNHWQ